MKRISSIILLVVFVISMFSFSSCNKEQSSGSSHNDVTGEVLVEAPKTDDEAIPKCILFADKAEAAPGEEVKVTFRMTDAVYFCCVSANILFDSKKVTLQDKKGFVGEEYYEMMNDVDSKVIYNGYVMTTVDFDSRDLMTATFKINEDAVSGSEAVFSLNLAEVVLGLEVTGAKTKDVVDSYSPAQISVKIK